MVIDNGKADLASRLACSFPRMLIWPGTHFSNFGRGSPKEEFCEIILKSVHWSRRCHLKVFLVLALVAILLSGVE